MSKKFSDLSQLTTPATGDILPVDDVSAGSTKKITISDLLNTPNAITFAALLSTIFSGQVSSQANAGTAGGTMRYINLGGIKLLWCISANQNAGATGLTYTFTLPTSFFSTVTMAQATSMNQTALGEQYANVVSASVATVTVRITSPGGAATSGISLLVIGT